VSPALLVFVCGACGWPASANPELVLTILVRWAGGGAVADPHGTPEPICSRCAVRALDRFRKLPRRIVSIRARAPRASPSVQVLLDATRFLAVSDWTTATRPVTARTPRHASSCVLNTSVPRPRSKMVDRAQWFLFGTACTGYADTTGSVDGLPADAGPVVDLGQSLTRACANEPQLCADAGTQCKRPSIAPNGWSSASVTHRQL